MPGESAARPVVAVRGEAQLEVAPDRAALTVTLHAGADTAERVRAALAEGSVQLSQILQEHADAIERSGTTGLHVSPVFAPRMPTRLKGYSGSLTTQIVVSDLEALPALLVGLTEPAPVAQGQDQPLQWQVDGPWWSLRPDHPAFREVRLAAISAARTRAEDYAAAFGSTLLELVEVSDLESSWAPRMEQMRSFAAGDLAGESAVRLEPVLQTVAGQVSVRFTISAPVLGAGAGES